MKDIVRMNQLAGVITENQARKMMEILNENSLNTEADLGTADMADQYKVPNKPGEDWSMKAFKNWEKWVKSIGKKNAIRKDVINYFIDHVVEFDGFDEFVTEQSVLDEIGVLKRIGHLDHLR